MNKYIVERIREKDGVETVTLTREVFAVSDKQAISQTRYELTRSKSQPNGEPTDYIDDLGCRIFWRATDLSPKKAPELEEKDTLDSITEITSKVESVHVIATGKSAERFVEIKKELGCKKNTDALAKILEDYGKPTPNGEAFLLPDRVRENAKRFATVLNCRPEDIYFRAVQYYLTKLGNMTLNDLLKTKEGEANA